MYKVRKTTLFCAYFQCTQNIWGKHEKKPKTSVAKIFLFKSINTILNRLFWMVLFGRKYWSRLWQFQFLRSSHRTWKCVETTSYNHFLCSNYSFENRIFNCDISLRMTERIDNRYHTEQNTSMAVCHFVFT